MRLDQIAIATLSHLLGRIARRAATAAIMAIFAIIAVYQFSVAGTLELALRFGTVNAHLIVGGIYTVLALISLVTLWAMRGKAVANSAPAPAQTRETQVAMLVEAAMLGYALARKNERAH